MTKTTKTPAAKKLTKAELEAIHTAKLEKDAARKRAARLKAKEAREAAEAATAPVEPESAPVAAPEPTRAVETIPTPEAMHSRINANDFVGSALSAGVTKIIGAVTFWSLHGIKVARDDLRAALRGLDLSFALPKDPKSQAVLRMAVDIVKRAAKEDIVFDRVSATKDEIVYAISSRATDSATERANYAHRTRLRLSKATGVVTAEDAADTITAEVVAKYAEIRHFITTTEFGLVLINALRGRRHQPGLGAVNLRGDTGGVYFVPAVNVERLNALAELVDAVGAQGSITVWPIPAGDRTIAQASNAARADILERIATTKADVQDLLNTIVEDDKPDPNGRRVIARAKSFAGLRARAGMYGELLGDMQAELETQIASLKAMIEIKIGAAMGDFGADLADDEAEGDDVEA